jgi:uncharacterized protein
LADTAARLAYISLRRCSAHGGFDPCLREEGRGGVRRLLRRIFDQWRIKDRLWYVPIIFLMPVIFLLTYGVMRLMGLPLPNESYIPFLQIPLLLVLFFILAIGEEAG